MSERIFDGAEYIQEIDAPRLNKQYQTIYDLMKDGKFRTLREISDITGYPEASISAQLRHARKDRFGNNTVNKQRRGEAKKGIFEYQLICSITK